MFKKLLMALVLATAGLATTVPASASFYSGGDWYGQNLTLADGDQLSGEFFNIGLLTLPTGATVSGIGSLLRMNAEQIRIDGSLLGDQQQQLAELDLRSVTSIAFNGSLAYWATIMLTAGTTIAIGDGASFDLNNTPLINDEPSLKIIHGGGDITLLPTPVPAAALLFCSGLGGLALLRRRSGLPG